MSTRLHTVPAEAPRVIGYIRVSTAREEMISPELQRQAIEDYCARRGYVLDEVIEDLDATGRNFARAGVQHAIERVESSGIAVVVVWKFSRFGRDRKGWAVNLDRVEAAGGRLESATEEVDATTSTGRFTRGMLAEVAAWESERIGDTWREAHANRHKDGLPHNGNARFGYAYHRPAIPGIRPCPQACEPGACKAGYVPDLETAPILAEMYERYIGGESALKIAVWLNGKGLQTTMGRAWTQRNARRFLDTGFAAGLLRIHDSDCRCPKPQFCDRKVLIPGAQPPVISEQVWDEYLRQRKKRRTMPPRTSAPVYPLSGLVRCGKCEGPMNASSGRPNKWKKILVKGYMYHCANYERSRQCSGSWATRTKVEAFVLEWLKKVAAIELHERAAMVAVRAAETATRHADRERLRREALKLSKALTQLTIDRASGLVPDVAYASARDELMSRQDEIGRAIEALASEEDEAPMVPPVEVAESLLEEWETLPVSTRREMLSRLMKFVVVTSHGKGQCDLKVIPTFPM